MPARTAACFFAAIASTVACVHGTPVVAGVSKGKVAASGPQALSRQLLAEFDTDRNGKLDSDERAVATRVLNSKDIADAGRSQLRRMALAELDANRSGTLERQELRAAFLAAAESPKSAATAKAGMSALKSTSSTTSPQPTQRFQMMRGASTGARSFLAQFDANGDGLLNATEMSAAQAALNQLMAQRQSVGGMNPQQLMSQISSASGSGAAVGIGLGAGGQNAGCPADDGTGTTTLAGGTGAAGARQGLAAQGTGGGMPSLGAPMGGRGGMGLGRMGGGGPRGMRRGR